MIKNLIFDFGKVLVDYDFLPLLKSMFVDEVERAEFMSMFCTSEFTDRCDKGDRLFSEVIDECRRQYPQWDRQFLQFRDGQLGCITSEMPGMHNLLTKLKEQGFKLYGLTNWSETVYPVIDKFDILQMMDGRVVSSEEKIIKPDIAIYSRLCEKYSLMAEECLFTDDKQVNVDGAVKAGMEAVLFTDAERYEAELVKRGLLI